MTSETIRAAEEAAKHTLAGLKRSLSRELQNIASDIASENELSSSAMGEVVKMQAKIAGYELAMRDIFGGLKGA